MEEYDLNTFFLPKGEDIIDTLDALSERADRLSEEAKKHREDKKLSRFYGSLAELGFVVRRMNEIERAALFSDGEESGADPEEVRQLSERFAVLCGCFTQNMKKEETEP